MAPVYRAMPQVAEVVEFPFQHGGVQFKARRRLASALDGRFVLEAITFCTSQVRATGFAPELRLRMSDTAREAGPRPGRWCLPVKMSAMGNWCSLNMR